MVNAMRGIRTEGEMAPEVSFANQRPAQYVFSRHVEQAMENIAAGKPVSLANSSAAIQHADADVVEAAE
jgi:hypothetical protein